MQATKLTDNEPAKENILVTGGFGYIGSHVLDELLARDCNIFVCDSHVGKHDERITVVERPLFDWSSPQAFADFGSPHRCIHLAWRDGFIHNAASHIENLPDHVALIRNLADAGIGSISIMGTMHEVGYWEGPIDESTPTNPSSLYAIAKNALRQCAETITNSSNTKLKWLRGFYIYGDDKNSNSIFGKIAQAAASGKKTFPFTSGTNRYDFIEITELARQIVTASLQDEVNGIINCCSGTPISLKEQVENYIRQSGYSIELEYGAYPDRPYDSPALWGDNRKIETIMAHADARHC